MSKDSGAIGSAVALPLTTLITPTDGGIASRVLARTAGGNVTLFAFDAGQGLEEHTSPFDALVLVQEGSLTLTIGGESVRASQGPSSGCPAAFLTLSKRRSLLECCWSCSDELVSTEPGIDSLRPRL
jgi:hypothetical protein